MLIKLAGAGTFGRGVHYFEEGRVSDVESTEKSTIAIVHGTHPYDVRLRHTHRMLEGACDCPASDGIDFCKHCVAVALVLHERQVPTKSIDKRSALRGIRKYLSQQTHEGLTEELLSIAKHNRASRDDLLQKAQFSSEAFTYVKLKKMITHVTPREHVWEFREVRAYFQGFEAILVRIADISDRLEPLVLLRSVEYAIRRLEIVLETVDDSAGYREDAMEILLQLHLNAISRLDWPTSELASYLVDRSLTDSWHPFQEAPDLYPEQLGEASHLAILAEIESRLNELPKLSAGGATDREKSYRRLSQLQEQLDAGVDEGD